LAARAAVLGAIGGNAGALVVLLGALVEARSRLLAGHCGHGPTWGPRAPAMSRRRTRVLVEEPIR
jgi:hypothetical protein